MRSDFWHRRERPARLRPAQTTPARPMAVAVAETAPAATDDYHLDFLVSEANAGPLYGDNKEDDDSPIIISRNAGVPAQRGMAARTQPMNAIEEWKNALQAGVRSGLRKSQAALAIGRSNPDLTQRFIAAFNVANEETRQAYNAWFAKL